MSQPDPPVDPGAIPALLDAVVRGRRIAERPEVPPGGVKLWTGSVRAPLRKAFGPESTVLATWPIADAPFEKEQPRETLLLRVANLERLIASVTEAAVAALTPDRGNRIFIGHGRSPVWRELKDFLADRLTLPWDEFNRQSVAGVATSERLHQMLESACFALLIMTAEDEHADATLHARENVVHEVGLFQGKLGQRRAIALLEEGCQGFSNIHGLSYISFPKGRIAAAFEEIRRVLERERIVGI